MTDITSLRNWVDDYILSDEKDWIQSRSDGNDQEFEFKKDQMELESESWARFYITFVPACPDTV